jgi:hypothetical protein
MNNTNLNDFNPEKIKNVKILGFSGNAGTGKDFLAMNLFTKMLTDNNNFIILSFADHFKIDAIVKEGFEREKVYGRKDKITRQALQRKGTEEGRDIYGDDIWVKILYEKIVQYSKRGIEYFFITDCRFPNEKKFVHKMGGYVIKINAPDRNNNAMISEGEIGHDISAHRSEQFIEQNDYDYVIDNSISNMDNVACDARIICLELREKWRYDLTIFCDLDDTLLSCSNVYLNVKNQIKNLLAQYIDPQLFETLFKTENAISREKVFSRDNFAKVFKNILQNYNNIPVSVQNQIYSLAMRVHDWPYKLFSEQTLQKINHLNQNSNFVIITLGDPVDQVRKLYLCGEYLISKLNVSIIKFHQHMLI